MYVKIRPIQAGHQKTYSWDMEILWKVLLEKCFLNIGTKVWILKMLWFGTFDVEFLRGLIYGLIINALRMHIFILVDHLACIIAVWTIEHCAKYISATHIMFNIYPPSYLWAIYNVFYNHHSVIMLFLYFTTYQYIMEMYLQK